MLDYLPASEWKHLKPETAVRALKYACRNGERRTRRTGPASSTIFRAANEASRSPSACLTNYIPWIDVSVRVLPLRSPSTRTCLPANEAMDCGLPASV